MGKLHLAVVTMGGIIGQMSWECNVERVMHTALQPLWPPCFFRAHDYGHHSVPACKTLFPMAVGAPKSSLRTVPQMCT